MQITAAQLDVLTEMINIGVGRAAGVLNQMTQFPVKLQVPTVRILRHEELKQEVSEQSDERLAAVQLPFKGSFAGNAALIFPTDSAVKLVAILIGEEESADAMDELRVGTLNEVGNIVLNGIMGSIGNILEQRLDYALPIYSEETIDDILNVENHYPEAVIMLAKTQFYMEERQIEGEILLVFELGSFDLLITVIDRMLQAGT